MIDVLGGRPGDSLEKKHMVVIALFQWVFPCVYIKRPYTYTLPAAHYVTKVADRRVSLLDEAKNSTTTGCFLLTAPHCCLHCLCCSISKIFVNRILSKIFAKISPMKILRYTVYGKYRCTPSAICCMADNLTKVGIPANLYFNNIAIQKQYVQTQVPASDCQHYIVCFKINYI